MKIRIARSLLFMALSSFAIAQQHDANSSSEIPSCVVTGVENGGPIITGSITDRLPASQDSPLGSVNIAVDRYLRGDRFPSGAVTLPVDLDLTKGPLHVLMQTKAVWHETTLQPRKQLLLMLYRIQNSFAALCVVDLASHSSILPTVERMVRLDSTEGSAKIATMENALSDGSRAVRSLAVDYLDSQQVRDPAVRQSVFQHFAPLVLDKQSPHRTEALEAIYWAYDSFAKDSELNYRILSFVAQRLSDPDPAIRSIAIQHIYSKLFGGGSNRPDPKRIRLPNRPEVLQQLKRDASGGLHEPDAEKEAARLLQAFST